MQVKNPNTNKMMIFTVPEGLKPGDYVKVQL